MSYADEFRALETQSPPPPWRPFERPIPVGGLTCVGFAEADGRELLLVVSHDGRGVFDFDGQRLARDPAQIDDAWHDEHRLRAIGIGPLDGVAVPIAGLWGGGLPLTTNDGWALERVPVDWPDERIVLRTPNPDGEQAIQIHHETLFETRAAGFSPGGTGLVIATSGEFRLTTR